MNIAAYQFPVFHPYGKSTLEIYVSGCNRVTCAGVCHNAEIRKFNYGTTLIIPELIQYIKDREEIISCISFTGGDLLCQNQEEALNLVEAVYLEFKDKELWLFTGEDHLDKIPDWCLHYFDVIKYGSFQQDYKQDGFPSSSNQKMWVSPDKCI